MYPLATWLSRKGTQPDLVCKRIWLGSKPNFENDEGDEWLSWLDTHTLHIYNLDFITIK